MDSADHKLNCPYRSVTCKQCSKSYIHAYENVRKVFIYRSVTCKQFSKSYCVIGYSNL